MNIRVTIDEDRDVVGYDDYYPFGLQMPGRSNNTANANDLYKFSGKELDGENNLDWYYFGARYYDPAIARWLQVDPLASKYPSLSPYNYVANNPIRAIDPDGKGIYDISSGLPGKLLGANDGNKVKNEAYGFLGSALNGDNNLHKPKYYGTAGGETPNGIEHGRSGRSDLRWDEGGAEVTYFSTYSLYSSSENKISLDVTGYRGSRTGEGTDSNPELRFKVGVGFVDKNGNDIHPGDFQKNGIGMGGITGQLDNPTILVITGTASQINNLFSQFGYTLVKGDDDYYRIQKIEEKKDD